MKMLILFLWSCAMVIPAAHAQAKIVACVGASNTYGYGLANRETDCYPAQLAELLQAFDPQWGVRNFGVSGTGVLQKGLLPYIGTGAFSQARACNPDVVVIQIGGNDSVAANWVYKDDFLADFLVLIDAFATLPSHPHIYVLSSPPFYSNPYGLNNGVVQGQIIPLMAQLPSYRDVHLIDLYAPMKDSRDLFQSDGVHFTPAGARLVAEIVAATILGLRGTPDFNGDEMVDIEDLVLLIEHWGQGEPSFDIAPPPCGDGQVDVNDLEALMHYWGCQVTDPTLVAHWKLDEAEGIVASDSAGGNDGTVIGVPTWQPAGGMVNGALEFNGMTFVVADFVRDPSRGSLSAFMWMKGGAPGQAILSQQAGANWLMLDPATGALMTELKGKGRFSRSLSSGTIITDGGWHRVGFTWDGSIRTLCVDDVVVAEDTQADLAACLGGILLGCGGTMAPGSLFTGLIDDVRIYTRVVQP